MTGIALGIVVQNNDPQKRGRVKIFIPHMSLNLYDDWDNKNVDKSFSDLSDPYIKDVIDNIKNQLPWANCAAPIFGEVGKGYYDSAEKKTKIGDNPDRVGDKDGKTIEDTPPEDAFQNKYEHNSYSNTSKGLFSIPKVGAKVWVFFENGNLNRPVYFATSYSTNDWVNIEDENYPDDLENIYGVTGETDYKNKVVVSQKGGVIEIVNTDNQESIQISQYKGSFKIWNNEGTKEYVEGDDKKYVKNEQQLHIGGNMRIHIDGNANILVDGTYTVESKGNMTFKAPRIDFNP